MIYALALYWLIAGVALFQARQGPGLHLLGCLIVGCFMVPVRILVKLIR